MLSLITYFIYKDHNMIMARIISEITELTLITLSGMVSITCFIKLKAKKFSYNDDSTLDYNGVLLIAGLGAIHLFGFYTIIAVANNGQESVIEYILLAIQIVTLVESTIQSTFIIDCLKMYSNDEELKRTKPGRSLITLLILIDVSLWVFQTFSAKKYDMNIIQIGYYDIIFWSIISSINTPFIIFFRFHASCCLSEIWANLYE